MADSFSTNLQSMQTAYDGFKDRHKEMTETLDGLARDVENSLSRWEDEAREAYFDVKAKWEDAADKAAKAIEEFAGVVSDAKENYGGAQAANTKIWS